ncbi:MAG: hypothetical protein JSR73_15265 [Proteobacteria bacterium]|nr:hypothetical protein [Pseudomonadota bacterium]
MKSNSGSTNRRASSVLVITLGVAIGASLSGASAATDDGAGGPLPTGVQETAPAAPSTASAAGSRHAAARVSGLDERVRLLAKELILSPHQQDEVRGILQQQQTEVTRAWRDESVPAATRVAATRAAQERTAERIRAILNDAQRERFSKPRPADAKVGGSAADLANWMDAMNGR